MGELTVGVFDTCAGPAFATGSDDLEMQAENAALRKELARLRLQNAELEQLVVRDTLTPLYNRRYFRTSLVERVSRVARYGARAVVLFVDVDNMKAINDAHGHAAGDFVLMHVARLLSGAIRASDVAARIGGDEFALILDEMDEEQAVRKMAALRALIRDSECRFGGVILPLSASFGATMVGPDDNDAQIVARADGAMYEQKRQRRSERA